MPCSPRASASTGEPNFEEHWHLRVYQPLEAIAETTGQPLSTVQRLLDSGPREAARRSATAASGPAATRRS